MFAEKSNLGQNFLINQTDINKFVDFCKITKEDVVLEIGIGNGALTQPISQKAKKVIGIEIDPVLIKQLYELSTKYLPAQAGFVLFVEADFLQLDLAKTIKDHQITKIISAIPYYITSPIIHKILKEACTPLKGVYLITQLEFAQKLMGRDGRRSYFTNLVERYAKIESGVKISNSSFDPIPKVDSFFFSFEFTKYPKDSVEFSEWSKFLHHTFKTPRKMINKRFDKKVLEKLEISETLRAENLSLEQIENLQQELTG
ncbi:ribosomal RNA small subunit methyltransferase A [Patescibacteria group bacterium]|nr:ribosomal RNA small subunit methyltransferase A [Patescibacteria group bacterium]